MKIPQTTLDPFGYTGVPLVVPIVRLDALAFIFSQLSKTFPDIVERWLVQRRARKFGTELPDWPDDMIAMRTSLAGGKDVRCHLNHIMDRNNEEVGFHLSISFTHEGGRYGSNFDYPEGSDWEP